MHPGQPRRPETGDAYTGRPSTMAPCGRSPAPFRAGRSAFLGQSCVNCHRVRGTSARGSYAPDLTHLMSRKTLASGMVENSPDNLRRWLGDPRQIKPGCLMPAFGLGESERDEIVRYLLTLR